MTELPWQRPPAILWTAVERAIWAAYEAEHSVTGYPDGTEVAPPPLVRARVLDITSRLPQLPPCEATDPDEPDIACPECEDGGEINVAGWRIPFCPECGREPNDEWAELFDDMERGK